MAHTPSIDIKLNNPLLFEKSQVNINGICKRIYRTLTEQFIKRVSVPEHRILIQLHVSIILRRSCLYL